jgi:protein TonB
MVAALAVAVAGVGWTQVAPQAPRLARAVVSPAPWNVRSAGISACDVAVDERGAVAGADLVQDVPPYGAQLKDDILKGWGFEPARDDGGRAAATRVLVLGLFMPPSATFPKPENPLYKTTKAPEHLPWPTDVAVPAYPPNVRGGAKVIVEADVSEQGAVASARVISESSGFDSAALDSVRRWVFRPASRGGRPLASRAFIVVGFPVITP